MTRTHANRHSRTEAILENQARALNGAPSVKRGKIMEVVRRPPESVFNTQCDNVVEFIEKEYQKHRNGGSISLYPHQIEAVLKLRKYFNRHKYHPDSSNIALVVLPTGCGKTGVAVLASYALNASRVLVITPSIIISKQIHKAYGNFLIQHGLIPPNNPGIAQWVLPTKSLIKKSSEIQEGMRSMVMVVNAHKIGGRSSVKIEDIPREGYDLVIVDEAHHYPAPTWKLLVDHFDKSNRLFLTATPEHKGKPILPIAPCYELKRIDAVQMGIIRDVKFDELTMGDEQYQYSVSYYKSM